MSPAPLPFRFPRRLQAGAAPLLLAALSMLGGCGGGGGGGGGSEAPADAVTLTPAQLNTYVYEGDDAAFEVTARVSRALSGPVVAVIVDDVGVIQPEVEITPVGSTGYTARFQLNPLLQARNYQGSLKLQLCKDTGCAQQHPGSPVLLPYVLEVRSSRNLLPLQPLAGSSDWAGFQGNAGHTGYAPVSLDAARFTRRWFWRPPGTLTAAPALNAVAVAGGTVFAATWSDYVQQYLYALQEADGAPRWTSTPLTSGPSVANPPLVSGGRVFLSTSGQQETALWSFDAATGSRIFQTPFTAQWQRYYAPVDVAGRVLTMGGYSGGLLGFDAGAGTSSWAMYAEIGYEGSTPAADATMAYAMVARSCNNCDDAGLAAIDPATGTVAYRIPVPGMGYANSSWRSAPVLDGRVVYALDNAFFTGATQRQLLAFSLDSRSVLWRASGSFVGSPVVGDGVVYVALSGPDRVQAHRASDGSLLWTFTAPAEAPLPPGQVTPSRNFGYVRPASALLLTRNLLFYSSTWQVQAIDLATHAAVWHFPRPGELSLSANGTLFIASSKGPNISSTLSAVNLR